MNLNDLKKEIPYKWRVQSVNEYEANCVAYIDARDVQDILDDVCGAENWQVKYEEHKGNLFASIGINVTKGDDTHVKSLWVWKSDCGTESQVEKQKGEASDAFKRAAVVWGVGRFLYSLEIIKIKEVVPDGMDRQNRQKYAAAYNGKKIWDINKHCNSLIKRRPVLSAEKFEKAKGFTKEQIQKTLSLFEMTPEQRNELTKIIN